MKAVAECLARVESDKTRDKAILLLHELANVCTPFDYSRDCMLCVHLVVLTQATIVADLDTD